MSKTKRIESNGRPGLGKVFRKFDNGDSVAVLKEPSIDSRFPLRIQGSTGVVSGRRGGSYIVEINTQNKKKKFIIAPAHLKRISLSA
ncbi:MAG: 50S ribosomal protein L21e [Nanoarchaeota archaeon]|nr:50S ribosomal protein L21e [Nanoarchaeota archaeon]